MTNATPINFPTSSAVSDFHVSADRDAASAACLDLLTQFEAAVRNNAAKPATWQLAGDLQYLRSQLEALKGMLIPA